MCNFRGVLLVLFIYFKWASAVTNGNIDDTSPRIYVFWPNATIPFYINSEHFDHEQSLSIMSTLAVFAFKTCLKFAPALAPPSDGAHVLVFENPKGIRKCIVDTNGHPRDEPHHIVLGYDCLRSPQIDMTVMKALGFPFEHNRNKRDRHIEVLLENVEPSAVELFTKDPKMPAELQALPYDVDSVMHFGEREYSKNGHRTIMFKDNPRSRVKQNRVTLTSLDLRKIEIVYGPECRTRDRQEKLELCKNYPGVARRKREIDITEDINLRVNRDITPPAAATGKLDDSLKDLGIVKEVQEVVDQVYKVSGKALKNAREKYCNVTKKNLRNSVHQEPSDSAKPDLVGIVESITVYAKKMVENAVANLTVFCEASENIEQYQRHQAQCSYFSGRPCPEKYWSTKSGAVRYSTQHRPVYFQSTKNDGSRHRHKPFVRSSNNTDDNVDSTDATGGKSRRKRSVTDENTTSQINVIGLETTPGSARKNDGDDVSLYNNRNDRDFINKRKSIRMKRDDVKDVTAEVIHNKVTDESEKAPKTGMGEVEVKNSTELDKEIKELENRNKVDNSTYFESRRTTKMQKKAALWARRQYVADKSNEHDWDDSLVSIEKTTTKQRKHRHRPRLIAGKKNEQDNDRNKQARQQIRPLRHKPLPPVTDAEEEEKTSIPMEVRLSPQNREFYEDRKWPKGVVKYMIQDEPNYNTDDIRTRLEEVNAILKKQTCVRLQEITESEASETFDYLVIDTSADYVTGRVGGKQNFGCLELFRGGQHRQHAAMMVMAMLGFYFEIARHDRDKYIRVHLRHVRPDKLHHFEKIRSEATLPLPYDYDSATHPAWQFWRKVGKTGISTVATFKTQDPDGKVMKKLGQNTKLLSEMDIVKINTIYGIKCFKAGQSKPVNKKKVNKKRERGF